MGNTLSSIFARMSHPQIVVLAEAIVKAMLSIRATLEPWSPLIPNIDELQTITQRFRAVHDAAETGNHVAVAERTAMRPELNDILTDMGDFMEIGARRDATLLVKTCFDVRPKKSAYPSRAAGLTAPENFTVKHGKERGMLIGKSSSVHRAKSYEVHTAYGDPTVEANWSHRSNHGTCTEMIMPDFEPGRNVYLRIRAIGTKSHGPWSNFITIMPV